MKAKKLLSGIMSLLIISTMAAGCSQKTEQSSTTASTETKVEESKQDIKKEETKVEGQNLLHIGYLCMEMQLLF